MTDAGLQEVIDRLGGPDEVERAYAAEDIGYSGLAAGVQPLVERLSVETSHSVRGAIFQAMERIDGDAVVSACIQLLRSADAHLRNESVQLLRRREVSVVPTLKELMLSSDRDLRKFALDVLNRADLPGSDGIYDIALGDEDVNVVYTAIENIGCAKKAGFRGRVAEMAVGSDDLMLTMACFETLVSIGDEPSAAAVFARYKDPATVPPVLVPGWLRLAGVHGSVEQAPAISALLVKPKGHLLQPALQALRGIITRNPSLRDDECIAAAVHTAFAIATSSHVRHELVLTLAALCPTETNCQLLLLCRGEQDPIVQVAAARALAAIGRPGDLTGDAAMCRT